MRTPRSMLPTILLASMLAPGVHAQDASPINFEEHVAPIINEHCLGCHRGSRARNGLKLDSVRSMIEGGSGGSAIVPGDASASLLFQLISRTREPFMPFDDDPLPDEMVLTIKAWIDAGALETKDSAPRVVKRPTVELSIEPSSDNHPRGEPASPSGLRLDPYWWSERANTITAMATSPWAPLIAISGHRQVVLYQTQTLELLGVLEFPEGIVNVLHFSRDGSVLIAGGGRSAARGLVVGWDVRTGARLFEIGDEPDAVLAADLTNDLRLVALGGPDRIVRVYEVETGTLKHELTVHTDWVTSLAFSPDGVLLATGDRAGGLFVWESDTGREFFALPAHQAEVTDLAWRLDSNVLASCGDAGAIRLFEMENGREIKSWSAHGGTLSIDFTRDGRLVTSGRDRTCRLWDSNGGSLAQFEAMPGIATRAAAGHESRRIFVGDWTGEVRVYEIDGGARAGTIRANPTTQLDLACAASKAREAQLAGTIAPLEQRVDEVARTLAARSEEAQAAEQAALQAAEQAANAQARDAELRRQVEQARAESAPARETLRSKQQSRDEQAGALEAAKLVYQDADSEMQAAIKEATTAQQAMLQATEAQREEAGRRLTQAEKLLDGATALAQMAAAKVAEHEVRLARLEAELSEWRSFTQPGIEAIEQLAQAADAAHAEAVALQQTAQLARTSADERTSVLTGLQSQLDAARAELETGRANLMAAQREASESQAKWAAQLEAIRQNDGRVPIQ